MACPHPDIDCEDCAEVTCLRHPQYAPPARLPLPRTDCTRCGLARIVADFIVRLEAEEAWITGDATTDTWAALHEDYVKGAGQ